MWKTLLIIMSVLLLAACGGKGNKPDEQPSPTPAVKVSPTPTPTEDPNAAKNALLSTIVGDHISEDFIESFKQTKSVVASAYDNCILKIEDFEKEYSIVAADEDEGIMLGQIAEVEKLKDREYKITTREFNGNSAEVLYSEADGMLSCKMEIDGSQVVERYVRFSAAEGDDADSYLTRILFENAQDAEIKGKRVYATVNDMRCRIKLKVCSGDTTESHPSYSGAVTLIPADGSGLINCLYLYDGETIIISDMDENVLASFSIK